MNEYEKRLFMAASDQVLTATLPENYDDENWSSDEYEDIDAWIVNHAWEPFENWDASQLWKQIDDLAYSLKDFHENEIKLALEEAKKDGVAV
jgi:hypothetical protein